MNCDHGSDDRVSTWSKLDGCFLLCADVYSFVRFVVVYMYIVYLNIGVHRVF